MNEHFYDVSIKWDADKKGIMHSEVLPTTIEVATPPQFPKGMDGIWSPEHLFVEAINSCLMTTFLVIAENYKLEYNSFTSNAVGKLELIDSKYMMSEVVLKPKVLINNQEDFDKKMRVLQKSEAAFLIANSEKSTMKMEPTVEIDFQTKVV